MNILQARNALLLGKTIFDMKLNVGYYARVSTDKNDQLNSLENQSNYFKEMINENKNWKLVGEYIDEGISGTSTKKRENFLKMIEDSTQGKIDLIVTKEISRFSRNVIDSIKYTEQLLNNGTIVYFISDNINTLYPDSEFRLTLMSSLAQDEVRKISERVKFGIKRKIKEGKLIGGNLTGYYYKDGKLIINEVEKPIIITLFNLYATGKYSFKKISDILYNKGYKSKNGTPYSGTTLKKFLTNPRYKGYYTANLTNIENYKTHKKIKVPENEQIIYKTNLIEPIVSEELWNKANQLYKYKKNLRGSNVITSQESIIKSKYTNKIICKEHNEPFVRCAGSNRQKNPTWVCKKYKIKGVHNCNSPIIREKSLDTFISNIIIKYFESYLNKVPKELLTIYNNIFTEEEKQKENKYQKELEKINSQKDKLINLNLNNIITIEELSTKLKVLNLEEKKLKKETCNKKEKINNLKKLKLIDKEINKILCISNNLNIYVDLFIKKIIVNKLDTRYKMNFIIHFSNNHIQKYEYQN